MDKLTNESVAIKLEDIKRIASDNEWKAVAGLNFATFRDDKSRMWIITINKFGIMSLKLEGSVRLTTSSVSSIFSYIQNIG